MINRFLRTPFCYLSCAVLLLAFLAGCQRYEDGPLISLRSKKARVVNDWTPSLLSRNDIDAANRFLEYNFVFEKEGDFRWAFTPSRDSVETLIEGRWDFAKAKEALKLEFELNDTLTLGAETRLLFLDIKRLKEKELWIEYIWEGDLYNVRMVPR